MEILGSFLDEEWESLSKLFSCGETDSLQYLDGSGLFSSNGEMPFLANCDQSLFFSSDHHTFTTNPSSFSQESCNNDAIKCDGDQQPYLDNNVTDHTFAPMNYYNMDGNNATLMMMPVFPDDVMAEILNSKGENQPAEAGDDSCKLKRKCGDHSLPESSPKKIPRVARNAQKNPRKNKKKVQEESNEEEGNGGGNRQSSSSCSSEDDSQEVNGGSTSESKGSASAKTKAGRGTATDPQSLYARRRREKINERLKILQNLVPNGTKVDISTMLEEAVQYVKFLQLQIKLLSSDDMWMYAPLAYNGMDIGMYQKICPNLMTT